MEAFARWLAAHSTGRPMFISDNNGFDWQFINWYFHHFLGKNPFGHSSTNLGSLYKGVVKDTLQELQAPAPDEAHPQPGRRRAGQRRGAAAHEGRAAD